MTINEPVSGAEAEDRTIREKLLAELKAQRWAEVSPANVIVNDGVGMDVRNLRRDPKILASELL
jgi:hypothetical protein